MSKLNVSVYDHGSFMNEVTEMLECILGRSVSELDNPIRLIDEARSKVNALFANINLAEPVADDAPYRDRCC